MFNQLNISSRQSVRFTAAFLLCTFLNQVVAQREGINNLKLRIAQLEQRNDYQRDTAWLNAINILAFAYAEANPDSSLVLLKGHGSVCREAGYILGEAAAYNNMGVAHYNKGDYAASIEILNEALKLCKERKLTEFLPKVYNNLGLTAMSQGNYTKALQYYYECLAASEAIKDLTTEATAYNNIAIVNYFQNNLDEAELNYKKALDVSIQLHDTDGIVIANNNIGEVYLDRNDFGKAKQYFLSALATATIAGRTRSLISANKNLGLLYYKADSLQAAASYFKKAAELALEIGYRPSACVALTGLSKTLNKQKNFNEALVYAHQALDMAETMGQPQLLRDANEVLAAIYESQGDGMQALKHYQLFKKYADSLRNSDAERMSERLKAEFDFSRKELDFERKALQQRWLIFSAFAALATALLVIFLVYRSRQKEKQANKLLHQKNVDIEHQKAVAEDALHQLQTTQKQLVQAEKMASLGELTAGIAHEIQNPLNFVNNFSEVSTELISEMKQELAVGSLQAAAELADDISRNLEKINHHGKRAADIVKGMLQHSRTSSGQRELTDINVLCDEYLRLAYHGLRAKDKSFNAKFETSFDETIPKLNIIPQDIGRVILNLINNAFYAVSEKKKQGADGYEPVVTVTTKFTQPPPLEGRGSSVEIRVSDNGNGIPEKIKDKIFQPFFTTKPTGQGTGLGLSLSYDIVTKGHGGELKVETKENEGTTFVIQWPVV
jgi:signal transduction histidine kinase/tetratricopeptide (TPR) repeat protein